jgi:AcrR family transcriptional regulator
MELDWNESLVRPQEAAMARNPARRNPRRSPGTEATGNGPPPATPETPASDRDRIVAAFLALLGEHAFEDIGYPDIAEHAGVSLSDMRGMFGSKLSMIGAWLRSIDQTVLSGGDADMAEEPPRERLFDVLMRRIEALAPHRPAIRSLMRSARRHLGLALALNSLAVRSQRWMLAAADIAGSGPQGAVRAQGMALLFARVVRTLLDDEDEGLARTMAALDRALDRAQRWSGFLDDLSCLVPRRSCRPWRRRHRRDEDRDLGEEEPVPI